MIMINDGKTLFLSRIIFRHRRGIPPWKPRTHLNQIPHTRQHVLRDTRSFRIIRSHNTRMSYFIPMAMSLYLNFIREKNRKRAYKIIFYLSILPFFVAVPTAMRKIKGKCRMNNIITYKRII